MWYRVLARVVLCEFSIQFLVSHLIQFTCTWPCYLSSQQLLWKGSENQLLFRIAVLSHLKRKQFTYSCIICVGTYHKHAKITKNCKFIFSYPFKLQREVSNKIQSFHLDKHNMEREKES
jgi:P2-related tail formation protein